MRINSHAHAVRLKVNASKRKVMVSALVPEDVALISLDGVDLETVGSLITNKVEFRISKTRVAYKPVCGVAEKFPRARSPELSRRLCDHSYYIDGLYGCATWPFRAVDERRFQGNYISLRNSQELRYRKAIPL